MKEWKVNQEVYHRSTSEFTDDLSQFEVTFDSDVVSTAVKYFTSRDIGWVYPGKSYMVAICYAKWIAEHFGDDFYELLNDPELLFNNDPHFKTYNESRAEYDQILEQISGLNFDESQGLVPDVKHYFCEEVLLGQSDSPKK